MEEMKNSYEKLRDILKLQFTSIIEQIKVEDAKKEQIQEKLVEEKNNLALGVDGELESLGINVQNLTDIEKDKTISDLRQQNTLNSDVIGRLSELEAMGEDVKFQQHEIENIENNLNQLVENNVNQIKKYQESIKRNIETRKQQVQKLITENETKGDSRNTNEIEQLNLEISKLEGYISVTDNFLDKYGSLEALRKAIILKEQREEMGYWMDDDKQEYDYFDDLLENSNKHEKSEPEKTEPVETEPVKVKQEKTEPVEEEPVKAKQEKTEPVEAEPVKVKQEKTEPVETEPVKVKQEKTEPAKVETENPQPQINNSEYKISGVYCVIENNEPTYYATIEDKNGITVNVKNKEYKGYSNYEFLTQKEVDEFEKDGFILPEQYIDANIFDLLEEIDSNYGTNALPQYMTMIKESYKDKNIPKPFEIEYDLSELWEKPKKEEDKQKLATLKKLAKTCKKEKLGNYIKSPNILKRMWHKITQKLITDGSEKTVEQINSIKMQEGPKKELTPEIIKEHYLSMHDEPGFDINEFVKNLPEQEADKYRVLDADYQESKISQNKYKQFKQKLTDWAKKPNNEQKTNTRSEEEQEKLEADVEKSIEETVAEKKQVELEKDVIKSIEETRPQNQNDEKYAAKSEKLTAQEMLEQDVINSIEQTRNNDEAMSR